MVKWECEEAKAVIIIVHGGGEHSGRYQWLKDQWNQNQYHVILGDLPGQGKTNGKRGHIDSFNQYIDTVYSWYREAYSYGLPIFILGHSIGGLIVIRTLMEKKLEVNGVILSSPCLSIVDPPSASKKAIAKAIHTVNPEFLFKSGLNTHLVTRNETIREEYLKDELRVRKVSVRWYFEMDKAMNKAIHKTDLFPNVPVLLVQSGEDYIVDKYVGKKWFNCIESDEKWYKEWPGLYHEVFNEPERLTVLQYALNFTNVHI